MKQILLLFILAIASHPSFAQPSISFNTVVAGLADPVDVVEVNDGSNRLFIVERTGTIRIWNGTRLSATPFLNIVPKVRSSYVEEGLLSIAFHPNYATNGYFYVYYTDPTFAVTVARYTRKTDSTANDTTGKIMFVIPKLHTNHNGGKLLFGQDGYLYFGTGDGGGGGDPDNNAQNPGTLLGKMLRVDVNRIDSPYYNIPPTNPYLSTPGVKKEIIANGLRNPWRYSFDKQTGDMWIADVGQDLWEEVNVVPAANRLNKNYGWNCFEATHVYNASCSAQSNNVVPIFEYPHNSATGGYSITGGYVYRGAQYPLLQGYYLFADYASGHLWLTKPNGSGGWLTTILPNQRTQISSFGETAAGDLYATLLSGSLLRVVAGALLPLRLTSFTGKPVAAMFELNWQVQAEEKGDIYVVEKRLNSQREFSEMTRLASVADRTTNSYTLKVALQKEQIFYRLKIMTVDGAVHYSNVVAANGTTVGGLKAFVSGGNYRLQIPSGTTNIQILDAVGRMLLNQKVSVTITAISFALPPSASGFMLVKALVNGEWQMLKVVY